MRGATPEGIRLQGGARISIHAPHAGRDLDVKIGRRVDYNFNPRAPCGARRMREWIGEREIQFQSTRPMRGATARWSSWRSSSSFQSTRPMRGATDTGLVFLRVYYISIHAPHAGRDAFFTLSALSVWISIHAPHAGRDKMGALMQGMSDISIHAPHAGRDISARSARRRRWHFNPRAPCGARLRSRRGTTGHSEFQSTRPMRGATVCIRTTLEVRTLFQSTRPMRGATKSMRKVLLRIIFQSTRPMRGATWQSKKLPLRLA